MWIKGKAAGETSLSYGCTTYRRSKAKEEQALIPCSLINRLEPGVTSFLHRKGRSCARPINIRRTLTAGKTDA